jgi:hypothetical protein
MDKKSSTGFEGLPEEWRILLKNSGISKEETLDNPQLVLDVLEFRSGDCHRPPPPMVKDAKMAAKMACSFIMKDPSQTYVDLVQVVDPLAGLANCIMRFARLRFATKVCSRTDNSSAPPDVPHLMCPAPQTQCRLSFFITACIPDWLPPFGQIS